MIEDLGTGNDAEIRLRFPAEKPVGVSSKGLFDLVGAASQDRIHLTDALPFQEAVAVATSVKGSVLGLLRGSWGRRAWRQG
jgi:hypothetical protein